MGYLVVYGKKGYGDVWFEAHLKDQIAHLLKETVDAERRKMLKWIIVQSTYKNYGFHKPTIDGLISDITNNYFPKQEKQ